MAPTHGRGDAHSACHRPATAGDEQQQRRPDQVELLLHTQRPVMQQRRRRDLGTQVVRRLEGEAQVRHVERGGDPVGTHVGNAEGREHDRRDRDRHEEAERRGRKQAPRPTRVEPGERDGAGSLELTDEQARDQEPGQHEEDVDADVSAGDPGYAGVEQQHEEDGDAAQALEVGAEATRWSLDRGGWRRNGRRRQRGRRAPAPAESSVAERVALDQPVSRLPSARASSAWPRPSASVRGSAWRAAFGFGARPAWRGLRLRCGGRLGCRGLRLRLGGGLPCRGLRLRCGRGLGRCGGRLRCRGLRLRLAAIGLGVAAAGFAAVAFGFGSRSAGFGLRRRLGRGGLRLRGRR